MKKTITLAAIIALSFATIAESKGGRSVSRSVSGKPIAAQKTQSINSNTQKDATFDSTPNRAIPNQNQAQSATGNNRLASFATGAAAGYVLSEMLAPTAAQAQTQTPSTEQAAANQAVENPQSVANATNATSTVATFKSIGGQIDPFLVEKTDGYRRYCIAGVQYLAPAQGGQTTPIVMVTPNGSPLACNLVQ